MRFKAMKYKINPVSCIHQPIQDGQQESWNVMLAEFDKNGDAGVSDFLLLGISLKEGKGSKIGNLDFLRHVVRNGWIIPV